MNHKTFIFDLDGVLVDTAKYHYLAWKNLANSIGIEFTHQDNEKLKGVSRVKSLELILELGHQTATQEQKDKWLVQKNEEYLSYIYKMDASEILPYVERVLGFLKENNQKIVLGSASKNARLILEKINIIDYFDAIVDGNDVSKAKPDPEVFLIGAQKTNSEPKNCIVFEDAIAGIEAANNAGMLSIGIGEKDILNHANQVFSDFTEISNQTLLNWINN